MEIKQTDVRHFVSIEYPGNVVNTDKAVETLGGIEELSKGFQQKQKLKLQLRQNFYAKAVFSSEPNDATGMLLKVKVRKSKKHPERKPEFVSAELAGTVSTMYKFGTLADYQVSFNLKVDRNKINSILFLISFSICQFKRMRKQESRNIFTTTLYRQTSQLDLLGFGKNLKPCSPLNYYFIFHF